MLSRRRALSYIAAPALLLPSKSRAFLLGTDSHPPGAASTVDGFAGAPAGTIQYPTLLNTYGGFNARRLNQPNFQPPWHVAGVDYHVGVPSTVTLTPVVNANGVLTPGFPGTLNSGNAVITVTSGGATISGWDFSVHGGYTLQLQGTCIITNCSWVTGTNNSPGQAAIITGAGAVGSITMTNCSVNGNAVDQSGTGGGLIKFDGATGNIVVQYCHLRNAWSEILQFGLGGNCNSVTCKFNIFENAGLGTRIPAEQVHGDWVQIWGGGVAQLQTGICNYNLFWQNIARALAGTQGWNWMTAGGNRSYINSMDMSNNTCISGSGTDVNFQLMADNTYLGTPTTNGTGTVFTNYVAVAGSQTDFGPGQWADLGPGSNGQGGRTTLIGIHGNIDMDTGGAAPNPADSGWINV